MTYDTIRSRFYLLTKTNVSSVPNATLNLYIQPAEDAAAASLLKADAKWQLDDTNRTDLPIATTALVSGQQDYSLAISHLTIDRVEVKDSSGNWTELDQIDQQDLKRDRKTALGAYESISGIPRQYDLVGNSVVLYPTPNYSQSASLKIYFSRTSLKYDYSTSLFTDGSGSGPTTDKPGFINELFHDLIPLHAAYDYCMFNVPELCNGILNAINMKEGDLIEFYGNRNRDRRNGLRGTRDSNK